MAEWLNREQAMQFLGWGVKDEDFNKLIREGKIREYITEGIPLKKQSPKFKQEELEELFIPCIPNKFAHISIVGVFESIEGWYEHIGKELNGKRFWCIDYEEECWKGSPVFRLRLMEMKEKENKQE